MHRTSDAISLALRFDAPIFTYKNILDKAGIYLHEQDMVDDDENDDYEEENEESLNDVIEEFLNIVPDEKTNEFSKFTSQELNDMLELAILNEDYEKAARLRDEISKRNL